MLTDQDYDRIGRQHYSERSMEDGRAFDIEWKIRNERKEAAASEARINSALIYAKTLVDEPVLEAIAILREDFGLSDKELDTVIYRWVMS